jgi:hydroxylamine reductase
VRSLRELLLYGMKGMAAYADHARILGEQDETVSAFFYRGLAALIDDSLAVEDLVALNMELGQANFRCMEILDRGHSSRFGHPVPTPVFLGAKKGPAILVSGHDLLDLYELLRQTEGKGIHVYTHGEMLPAHGYPVLKKFAHLAGNYGGAWQDQQKEFALFPGSILMTTNCIQKPGESYRKRIFTTGLVAWPGVNHIINRNDFSPLIAKALELGGFAQDVPGKTITVGFGHDAVLSVADRVIDAVKAGRIRRFFLIGGCDGAKSGRNYYTEFAEKAPPDTMILTLACGKYRFHTLDFGEIDGIPRLLDVGQCNDSYSAIRIAQALAGAFQIGINDLPLSLILSWYEQKAVVVLLTLLSLGIRDIRLGPTLPAFVSPNVLKVLVDRFHIMPITTAEQDLQKILRN